MKSIQHNYMLLYEINMRFLAHISIIRCNPIGWVHLVGGAADLQGGPIFFSNAEKQENKRDHWGQQFSRGARPPCPSPPTLRA